MEHSSVWRVQLVHACRSDTLPKLAVSGEVPVGTCVFKVYVYDSNSHCTVSATSRRVPASPQCRQSLPVTAVPADHFTHNCRDPQIVSVLPKIYQNLCTMLMPKHIKRTQSRVLLQYLYLMVPIHPYSQYSSMAGSIAI